MTTQTTNYNLNKPADGDVEWGTEIRANWDSVDALIKLNEVAATAAQSRADLHSSRHNKGGVDALSHDALEDFLTSKHFIETSINHVNIQNVGSNTHAQIDTHLALVNEHIDWTSATANFLTSGTLASGAQTIIGGVDITLGAEDNVTIDGSATLQTHNFGLLDLKVKAGVFGTRCIEMEIDINGQADTMAIEADYVATGMVAGDIEVGFDLSVDTANATGGILEAMSVNKIGAGTMEVEALHVDIQVVPIHQDSGSFGAVETALTTSDESSFTDITTAAGDSGNNATLFASNNDFLYLGMAAKFGIAEVILNTVASGGGIKPEFAFSTGAGTWMDFGPNDSTGGFKRNGEIDWEPSDLSGWATASYDGNTKYWIKVKRTRVALSTVPIEETLKVSSPTEYIWDENGDLSIGGVSVGRNIDLVATTAVLGQITQGGTRILHTFGTDNIFVGAGSGTLTLSGADNTGVGAASLKALTSGAQNTAVGERAMEAVLTGAGNTAVGFRAGRFHKGSNNVFVGVTAGQGSSGASGSNSVYIGRQSAFVNAGVSSLNVVIGDRAGFSGTNYDSCVFLGYRSGYYETADAKLFIDNQSRTNEATSRVESLVYGIFDATVADQEFHINAKFYALHAATFSSTIAANGHITLANTKDLLCATEFGSDLFSSATPGGELHLGDVNSYAIATTAEHSFYRADNTWAAPAQLGLGITIAQVRFLGYHGGSAYGECARITVTARDTFNDANTLGTAMFLGVAELSGSAPVTYIGMDGRNTRIDINRKMQFASTVDIWTAVAGSSDLGRSGVGWGNIYVADAKNLIFGTTTGTEIGTAANQKVGRWGVGAVVQPLHIIDADGTLGDITTKFNTLLAQMAITGMQAAS